MIPTGELRIECLAERHQPARMRQSVAAFLAALAVAEDDSDDILTAVGEALANSVEHAYAGGGVGGPGAIRLHITSVDERRFIVTVSDTGTFKTGPRTPNRGFGLQIMRTIADSVAIDTAEGTTVRMTLGTKVPRTDFDGVSTAK